MRRQHPRPAQPKEEVEFAMDSPLEGRVSCELVSENAKFPASRENTGNFRYYVASATTSTFSSANRHPTICGWPIHTSFLHSERSAP
jgi:hypothetical protein